MAKFLRLFLLLEFMELSDPTLRPPLLHYRVWLYLSHLDFRGIARYRAIPPFWGVSQKYVEGGGQGGGLGRGGVLQVNAALSAINVQEP